MAIGINSTAIRPCWAADDIRTELVRRMTPKTRLKIDGELIGAPTEHLAKSCLSKGKNSHELIGSGWPDSLFERVSFGVPFLPGPVPLTSGIQRVNVEARFQAQVRTRRE